MSLSRLLVMCFINPSPKSELDLIHSLTVEKREKWFLFLLNRTKVPFVIYYTYSPFLPLTCFVKPQNILLLNFFFIKSNYIARNRNALCSSLNWNAIYLNRLDNLSLSITLEIHHNFLQITFKIHRRKKNSVEGECSRGKQFSREQHSIFH